MKHPTTASLFDDEAPDPGTSLIEVLAQSKPLTKAQLNFQRQMQLEIEQFDAAPLASVSPQRLAHCTLPFREALDMGVRSAALSPATIDQYLSADLAQLRRAIRELEQDMLAFRDPIRLRESLRHYPLEQGDDVDDLAELLSAFGAPAPSQPRAPRPR